MIKEEIIIRFLENSCSAKELEELNQWMEDDPKNSVWLFDMERIFCRRKELKSYDQNKIHKAYQKFTKSVTKPHKRIRLREQVAYIVAAVLLILFSLNIVYQSKTPLDTQENKIYVPVGQRVFLTLSDGTKVWLNSGTEFSYPTSFDKDHRDVTLTGEGFFEVKHDAERPFVLHNNLVNLKVLGTTFNARCYPQQPSTVILVEGKVEMMSVGTKESIILKPNDRVTYERGEPFLCKTLTDVHNANLWIKGEVVYDNESLYVIAAGLERAYNITIKIKDKKLAHEKFICHFQEGTKLHEVLNLLKATRRMDYKMRDNYIEFYNLKK